MNRIFSFAYGVTSYTASLVTFLYLAGFIGNFGVPKTMDSPADGHWVTALIIDLGLLAVFALQHSVMARPGFKRFLTRFVPEAVERSTYVLASCLAMFLLFWQWRPLGGTVWNVQSDGGKLLFYGGYAFGWVLLLFTTFIINHFDLFGLRQVWRNLLGKSQSGLKFTTPLLYRVVRHPLYVGWLCIFWSSPVMTATHLFFALATTAYIFIAIQFEERDLIAKHPEYAEYRRQVPMIVPGMPKRVEISSSARSASV
jgi:protein-S-isoprenylcysteine O-methyltransferase Ste14